MTVKGRIIAIRPALTMHFDETTMDACLIAAGQRAEHYEWRPTARWSHRRRRWATPRCKVAAAAGAKGPSYAALGSELPRRLPPEPLSFVIAHTRPKGLLNPTNTSGRQHLQRRLRSMCGSCSLLSQVANLVDDRCQVRRVGEAAQFSLKIGAGAAEAGL